METKQGKLEEMQSELDAFESKIKNDEELSREDMKFISELGWFSAAAVTIASIAANL